MAAAGSPPESPREHGKETASIVKNLRDYVLQDSEKTVLEALRTLHFVPFPDAQARTTFMSIDRIIEHVDGGFKRCLEAKKRQAEKRREAQPRRDLLSRTIIYLPPKPMEVSANEVAHYMWEHMESELVLLVVTLNEVAAMDYWRTKKPKKLKALLKRFENYLVGPITIPFGATYDITVPFNVVGSEIHSTVAPLRTKRVHIRYQLEGNTISFDAGDIIFKGRFRRRFRRSYEITQGMLKCDDDIELIKRIHHLLENVRPALTEVVHSRVREEWPRYKRYYRYDFDLTGKPVVYKPVTQRSSWLGDRNNDDDDDAKGFMHFADLFGGIFEISEIIGQYLDDV